MPLPFTGIGALIGRGPALRGGRPTIAGTAVCVRTIAIESNRRHSPEEIAAVGPLLSLAQIYGGLAFYHANNRRLMRTSRLKNKPTKRVFVPHDCRFVPDVSTV